MECRNCGFDLKPAETVCPVCQTSVNSNQNNQYARADIVVNSEPVNQSQTNTNNVGFEHYRETQMLNKQLGFNTLLVLSIVEMFCCNQLFGIVALVILFIKFKPAIESRDLETAKSTKKVVSIILIAGLIIGILANVGWIVLSILSEL